MVLVGQLWERDLAADLRGIGENVGRLEEEPTREGVEAVVGDREEEGEREKLPKSRGDGV